MTPLLIILSIVGAFAVVAFGTYLVIGGRSGWKNKTAARARTVGIVAAFICAVLGIVIALTSQ